MLHGGTHILFAVEKVRHPSRNRTQREPRLITSGTVTWWLADGACDTGSA
jgi:hypothetical protein